MSGVWPWAAVALLGIYHGIDPSMGWLFAVALGLQEQRRSKVVKALVPIAGGHLLSVGLIVALVAVSSAFAAPRVLRACGAGVLLLVGAFKALRPLAHPRWVAMRVGSRDLILWSFLMATAHGAGLMLFPILMRLPAYSGTTHHHLHGLMHTGGPLAEGVMVVLLHTVAMFTAMGAVAMLIYEWFGLAILRSAWVNLDMIWTGALIAAGLLAFWV